jgi:hypothetical protein
MVKGESRVPAPVVADTNPSPSPGVNPNKSPNVSGWVGNCGSPGVSPLAQREVCGAEGPRGPPPPPPPPPPPQPPPPPPGPPPSQNGFSLKKQSPHSHTGTAYVGRAIEVAFRIPEQSCVRIGAIGFPGKAVQRVLLAVLVHLVPWL